MKNYLLSSIFIFSVLLSGCQSVYEPIIEEAVEKQEEEVYILDAFVKDVYLHMRLNTKKEDLGPTLNKMEEYFAELEDYEKCAKILEYKELLKRGTL